MRRLTTVVLAAASLTFAQERASIHGVVRGGKGEPIAGASVLFSGPKRGQTKTNADGEFDLVKLPGGRYRLRTFQSVVGATKYVTVVPAQKVYNVSLRLEDAAVVAGRVLDDNREPMAGVRVYLVGSEYRYGALRDTFRDIAETNDRGEYRLSRAKPGVRYTVMAMLHEDSLPSVSDAPRMLGARRPAFQPTFYPKSPAIDGAERLLLRGGEEREGIDIEMRRTASYCVEGETLAAGAGVAMDFTFGPLQPSSGIYSDGGTFARPPRTKSAPDGSFRVCGLSPGEYRMLASLVSGGAPSHLGAADFVIVDRDLTDAVVAAGASWSLPGETRWAGEAPEEPVSRKVNVSLRPVYRAPYREEMAGGTVPVPGEFSIPNLFWDAYEVQIRNLDQGWYLAAVEYGGRDITYGMLLAGSARADAPLKLTIARDGGTVLATVLDEDSKPVTDGFVYVVPESAVSECGFRGKAITIPG